MSDFLSKLIARSFSDAPAIQPRVPSLFEPTAVEFFDEPQSSTPIPQSSLRGETAITKSVANVPDTLAKGHPAKPDTPAHQHAPVSAKSPHSGERTADRTKLEVETKRITVPVDSSRDGKKDAGHKEPPSEAFSEPRPIQRRRLKDFSLVEQRPSTLAPVIRVTIGRVEVRAIHPPATVPKPAKPAPPKLSLEDYLHKRERGSR